MNMAKDPTCGMMVDEKKQNSNPTTTAKHSISALPPAKQHSTKAPAKFAGKQGTVAIAAVTTAKPLRFSF